MGFQIGSLRLENRLVLAPLAGYTDVAFRQLCREHGAGLCYSEMISCHGLAYRQQNTLDMLKTVQAERPVTFQLFGADPEIMGEAAAILSEYPVDLIDINMGCPVKKVIKKGAGAALMKNPRLAAAIIEQVRRRARVPVTVKMRLGWNHQSLNGPAFARLAAEAGAQAVAVHARTWTDGFSGTPLWEELAKVKQAVGIPVIGNGDLHSYEEGMALLDKTGCDGAMIGRAALGNPWIFRPGGGSPSLFRRVSALARHLELIESHFNPERVFAKTKNHAGKYLKGAPGGAGLRQRIYAAKSFEDLRALVRSLQERYCS